MKINTNLTWMSAKELKAIADEKWIEYKNNYTQEQMLNLLKETQITEIPEAPKTDNLTLQGLLKQIEDLKQLVNQTGDINKIKEYERGKEKLNNFAFSVKLFPTENWDYPIISWRTLTNFVDLSTEKIKEDQTIEITYIKDWEELKEKIRLPLFATFLKRTPHIIAKSIKNIDGTDLYISKHLDPESKLEYYKINPTSDTFNVTLDVNWQEISILSTYLNA